MIAFLGPLLVKLGLSGVGKKVLFVGFIGLTTAAILGLGYWHYSSLLEDVSRLRESNAALRSAVKTQGDTILHQEEAIQEWKADRADLVRRMEVLAETSRAARSEARRLHDLFRRHDLERIATERPTLLEDRVNGASDRARCLLERASGADRPDCGDAGGEAGPPGGAARP